MLERSNPIFRIFHLWNTTKEPRLFVGKTDVFEARSNEWRKGSKGIRIILPERQGSNPLSIHRALLPFGEGKKGEWSRATKSYLGAAKSRLPVSCRACCFRAIEISRGGHRWGTQIGNGTRWTLDLPRGKNSPLKEDNSQICDSPRAIAIFYLPRDFISSFLRWRTF